MSAAGRSRFVYATCIRTTPEKLWQAPTDPEVIPRDRLGTVITCDWPKGSPFETGEVAVRAPSGS
jgi:hypothetical protein